MSITNNFISLTINEIESVENMLRKGNLLKPITNQINCSRITTSRPTIKTSDIWNFIAFNYYDYVPIEVYESKLKATINSLKPRIISKIENENFSSFFSNHLCNKTIINTTFSGCVNNVQFDQRLSNNSFCGMASDLVFNGPVINTSFSEIITNIRFNGPVENSSFSGVLKNVTFKWKGRNNQYTSSQWEQNITFINPRLFPPIKNKPFMKKIVESVLQLLPFIQISAKNDQLNRTLFLKKTFTAIYHTLKHTSKFQNTTMIQKSLTLQAISLIKSLRLESTILDKKIIKELNSNIINNDYKKAIAVISKLNRII